MNKSHIIGIILARKGSKRLKDKNLKKIKNVPLCEITINFAKKLKFLKNIIISSDDKRIIKLSKRKKILVLDRPKRLSKAQTSSEETSFHLLNWYEKKFKKIDGILLLQPTSPFRSIENFNKAFRIFKKEKTAVIGVTKINKNPKLYFLNRKRFILNRVLKKKNFFNYIDGSLYLIPRNIFFKQKTFVPKKFRPIENDKIKYSIDIDYEKDLKLARLMFNENF